MHIAASFVPAGETPVPPPLSPSTALAERLIGVRDRRGSRSALPFVRSNRRAAILFATAVGSIPAIVADASANASPVAETSTTAICGQACVTGAVRDAFRAGGTAPLIAVADETRKQLSQASGAMRHHQAYWLAYADYRLAIASFAFKQPDAARDALAEADRVLTQAPFPDAETYALHSLVLSIELGVTPPADQGALFGRQAEAVGRAGAAGDDNLRVLYARASSDFYTPKQYGGGSKAEGLLRKALLLPEQPPSPLRPTWGRDDCVALLARLLTASGRAPEAQALLAEWRAKLPDSVALRATGSR